MSKFKGTPGPWGIVSMGDMHAVTALKDGVRYFVTAGGCGCCNEIEECIGKIEDARLIAAAPKLLDAAIMAIEHYDAYFEGSEPPEDLPWVPVMREAIKEALGEDQQ